MLALIQTCDQDGFSLVAEAILEAWDHEPGSARLLRASSNFIFTFRGGGQRRVLRFVPAGQRQPSTIQAELDFIRHAAALGVNANLPVPSRQGHLVETAAVGPGTYHAVVFEFLPGELVELDTLPPEKMSAWGRTLGELHNAAQGFHPVDRPDWRQLLAQARDWLEPEDPLARAVLDRLSTNLAPIPEAPDNYGLIHYDFELDNLIWDENEARPGVIDFDDCIYAWFAADVAYALRDLFDDRPSHVDLCHPTLQAFVAGYRIARPLPEEELANLLLFLLLLNLHKYAQLGRIISEGALQDEPEWTTRLRRRLESIRAKFREEFEHYLT